jgi:hypothetical protein
MLARRFQLSCVAWLATCLLWACGGDAVVALDAGAKSKSSPKQKPSEVDAGHPKQKAEGAAGKASAVPMSLFFDAGPFINPPACPMHVGAECDDRADCPHGGVCCAHFDPMSFGYASIGCEASCDDLNHFQLCHSGESCPGAYVCRPSLLIPFSFISVCGPLGASPSAALPDVKGKVACGATSCDFGSEKCCLTAHFDSEATFPMPERPYCAPVADECVCGHSDSANPELDAGDAHE